MARYPSWPTRQLYEPQRCYALYAGLAIVGEDGARFAGLPSLTFQDIVGADSAEEERVTRQLKSDAVRQGDARLPNVLKSVHFLSPQGRV